MPFEGRDSWLAIPTSNTLDAEILKKLARSLGMSIILVGCVAQVVETALWVNRNGLEFSPVAGIVQA